MDFEMVRGDTVVLKFRLNDMNGNVLSLADGDMLYMTVKKTPNDKKTAFQKRLGKGIVLGDDGYYCVSINSNDTSKLAYGDYGYDIELKASNGVVKTLTIGGITLTEEYTFREDEV